MPQAHIYCTGTVQGVGFRYTVRRLAVVLKLKGCVQNLVDGRVELIAEGSQETIEQLLLSIEEHFGRYIRDRELTWESLAGAFSDFQIR